MRIICKYKDWYDYFGHVINPENSRDDIVYDRRDCRKLSNSDLVEYLVGSQRYGRINPREKKSFALEVGYTQYFITLSDIDGVAMTGKFSLDKILKNSSHMFKEPMSICGYRFDYRLLIKVGWDEMIDNISLGDCVFDRESRIANPILSDTDLVRLIDPREVWIELDQYLSSLKNDVSRESEGLTDRDKALNHGFSHPESFRKM